MQFPTVLDSSMLATFKSCPQKFYLQYIHEWKSKGLSVHLHAGGAFAKAIERTRTAFFVEGKSSEDAVGEGLGVLLQTYGDFECPPDSAKSAERMAGAFEFYFANYPLGGDGTQPITFSSGRKGIEFSFAEPIDVNHPDTDAPLIYSGRMDAILEYSGLTLITDEKTTTSLGPSWARQWDLRSQFVGYSWGTHRNAIKVDGVLVRGISILKTKYETQQAIMYVQPWLREQWYEELLGWIRDIVQCYKTGVWRHNYDHSCTEYGGCGFKQVCLSPADSQQPWLENYFERRHWDPIVGKETLLSSQSDGGEKHG